VSALHSLLFVRTLRTDLNQCVAVLLRSKAVRDRDFLRPVSAWYGPDMPVGFSFADDGELFTPCGGRIGDLGGRDRDVLGE
jgi:hypothetical protein